MNQSEGRFSHVLEAEHDSLWYSSTPTGVNDGRHLILRALLHLLDFLSLDTVSPLVILQSIGAQRERNALESLRNALLHLGPRLRVKLAHKQKLRLAVLQRVLGRVRRQGGVNRHAHVTSHHDGQVGHEPPGAVLTHDGNLTRDGEVEALDVGGHLLGFGEEFAKGPGFDGIAAHGLREEDFVGVFGAVVEDVVGDDLAIFFLG
mmetsp:Transcript_17397/g.37583  ORF Transcript_17397/g.37583 Transcript_17397/m.37583 type:complete len:204 (-) Transcript_17397:117-728(-)